MKVGTVLELASCLGQYNLPITGISLPQDEWDELVDDFRLGYPIVNYVTLGQLNGEPTFLTLKGLHVELRRTAHGV